MRKSIVTVLAALSALGLATPAAAADISDAISVTVTYGDLDIAAPEGAAKLDQRIEGAVKEVCARPDIRDLKAMAAWEECKASAKAGALEQISVLEPYESLALASVF